jgi:hypothetical protein
MKTKLLILFTILLALSFVFVSCDTDTTPDPNLNAPYENLPNLRNYDAIFIGEFHDSRQNKEIQLSLIKYYYSQGIRDFAFEGRPCSLLLLGYYVETGDKECLDFLGRDMFIMDDGGMESYNFWKDLHNWNSTLEEKIKIHSFDTQANLCEHMFAALWLFIFRNYPEIKGVPHMPPPRSGSPWLREEARDLVNDFRKNKQRYSSLNAEDMVLMEKIIEGAEIGLFSGTWEDREYHVVREQYMVDNIRGIRRNNNGRKIFAVMGAAHSSFTESTWPGLPSLTAMLKNEMRIASLALTGVPDTSQWPYTIFVDNSLKVTPFVSTYTGNWPYSLKAKN